MPGNRVVKRLLARSFAPRGLTGCRTPFWPRGSGGAMSRFIVSLGIMLRERSRQGGSTHAARSLKAPA